MEIFFSGKTHSFIKENGQYLLSFDFPYTSKEEISLIKNNDELIIQVGVFRRNINLPKAIAALSVKGAKLENGKLIIKFAAHEDDTIKNKVKSNGG